LRPGGAQQLLALNVHTAKICQTGRRTWRGEIGEAGRRRSAARARQWPPRRRSVSPGCAGITWEAGIRGPLAADGRVPAVLLFRPDGEDRRLAEGHRLRTYSGRL